MDRRDFIGILTAAIASTPVMSGQTSEHSGPPLLVPAGTSRNAEGKTAPAADGDFRFLLRTADSGGRTCIFSADTPTGKGPHLHVHHEQDEWFYILSGEMVAEVGGKLYRLRAGDSFFAPMQVPHRYGNPAPTISRYLIICAPGGGIEQFFEALEAKHAAGPLSHAEYAKLWEQFHMTLLGDALTMDEMKRAV